MYLSLEWLSDFLELSQVDSEQLAERISRTGIEIEGVENYGKTLSHLVVGFVEHLEPHPEADKLNIAQVKVGDDQVLQIVCGAPNIVQGAKVICALPGAVLPMGEIQQTEIRNIPSSGMLCSYEELGFKSNVIPKHYSDGIVLLPEDAPVGEDIITYLKLNDPIFELSLTPNRADALSVLGNAYEVGAILNQTPKIQSVSTELTHVETLADLKKLKVDANVSEQYQLRLIQNVKVAESPIWMQMRLMKSGIRPVNNIVDITNYLLLLYGQPMHAFDYDKLTSDTIEVRYAKDGEKLLTLDQVERSLVEGDGVICDGDRPIALAGVMGGYDTEVTESTKNVLLETAIFNPQAVRLTSKRLGLRSESSQRFEKGLNKQTVNASGDYAVELMQQLAGGTAIPGYLAQTSVQAEPVTVTVRRDAIERQIGIELTDSELEEIIQRLGFAITLNGETFDVQVPPRRWDIQIEPDVIEEIARIYGYDHIPNTLPQIQSPLSGLKPQQLMRRTTRRVMEGLGLHEVISYSLQSSKHAQLLANPETPLIQLALPLSEERSVLRQSLLPALLEITQYNQARRNDDLALFELGRVFQGHADVHQMPKEVDRLGIVLSGHAQVDSWSQKARYYDFYDLKGMLEAYFEQLQIQSLIQWEKVESIEELHPGRSAQIKLKDQMIGIIGQVHPTLCREYDIHAHTYFAEIYLDRVYPVALPERSQQPIPKYPASMRDIALLVSKTQNHQQIVDTIYASGVEYLESVTLFDYYQGEAIDSDHISLAYRLIFQNPDQTMSDEDVDQAMQRIESALLQLDDIQLR